MGLTEPMSGGGVVYVLTNPLMPGLCKIGMTTGSLEVRMKQLYSSGVPVPFECPCAVTVPNPAEVEKLPHDAFGDHRVNATREFFRIDQERLRAALRLTGGAFVTPKHDVADTPADVQALNEAKKRQPPFAFTMIGLKPGDELTSAFDDAITCTVSSDKKVLFRQELMSLSAAALIVAHEKGYAWSVIQGPQYWKHDGSTLAELRDAASDALAEQDEGA